MPVDFSAAKASTLLELLVAIGGIHISKPETPVLENAG